MISNKLDIMRQLNKFLKVAIGSLVLNHLYRYMLSAKSIGIKIVETSQSKS